MSVPNQKKIYIQRETDNAKRDYLKVGNDNLHAAMYNLKSSTFMLWVYFVDNANGYGMDLYPVDFLNITGMGRSTYDRSFKELEEKGYLLKSKVANNTYLFMEKSEKAESRDEIQSVDKEVFENIKKEFFSDEPTYKPNLEASFQEGLIQNE